MPLSHQRKRLEVMSRDDYLCQKIKLTLLDFADVVRISNTKEHTPGVLLLFDCDTLSKKEMPSDAVSMGRAEDCRIKIPISFSELLGLTKPDDDSAALILSDKERCAILRGEQIRLTEVEYTLLSSLIKRSGAFASREELLFEVWNGERDSGVVNVYIHYLREKLECGGEKIIISSRKHGYAVDEKFLGRKD